MDYLSDRAKNLKQGAIREMFDRAAAMENVISMGIGEPDMATPEVICQAAAEALRRGETHYTPNAGDMRLRRAIVQRSGIAGLGYDPAREVIVTNGRHGGPVPALSGHPEQRGRGADPGPSVAQLRRSGILLRRPARPGTHQRPRTAFRWNLRSLRASSPPAPRL